MKAAYIEKVGPPENIRFGDLPKPKPSGSQVLVHVKAVSVNPIDTYIRSGAYPMELPSPFIVGCDLAGVVEAVGPEVKRLKVGDRVWGSNQGLLGRQGSFADFVAAEECLALSVPRGSFRTRRRRLRVGRTDGASGLVSRRPVEGRREHFRSRRLRRGRLVRRANGQGDRRPGNDHRRQ